MNNYKYEEQSGRSMIEMLGVLAIFGVLSVGGIAGFSKAMNKFKTNKVADNVAMIVTNIRTLYAQQKDYSGLENLSAVQMGVVPDELITATPTQGGTDGLQNAFLGSVVIKATNVSGLDGEIVGKDATKGVNRGFLVAMNGLTKEACVTLATNDWGSGYSSGLVGISVKGAAQTAAPTGLDALNCAGSDGKGASGKETIACAGAKLGDKAGKDDVAITTPLNVAKAAAACSASGNANSIVWVYY